MVTAAHRLDADQRVSLFALRCRQHSARIHLITAFATHHRHSVAPFASCCRGECCRGVAAEGVAAGGALHGTFLHPIVTAALHRAVAPHNPGCREECAAAGEPDFPERLALMVEKAWGIAFAPGYTPDLPWMAHLWHPVKSHYRPLCVPHAAGASVPAAGSCPRFGGVPGGVAVIASLLRWVSWWRCRDRVLAVTVAPMALLWSAFYLCGWIPPDPAPLLPAVSCTP